MAYIDAAYYLAYTGETEAPAEFAIMEARAEAIIDDLTMDRIYQAGGILLLPAYILERVKKAVAEQVRTIDQNGGPDALASQDMVSVGIGKFSYSTKAGSGSDGLMIGGIPVSPMVITYLAPTGFLYRGWG